MYKLMRGRARRLAALGCVTVIMYMLAVSGAGERIGDSLQRNLGYRRMKNVLLLSDNLESHPTASALSLSAGTAAEPAEKLSTMAEQEPAEVQETIITDLPEMELMEPAEAAEEPELGADLEILETTIDGGLTINNATQYWVDAPQIVADGPGVILPYGQPQILIIHTHSSEAYTQAGLDRYEPSDTNRTEDTEFNIVRIGDELTEIFQEAGLSVIHDRGIYDYPSYTGSYTRSGQAIEQYLRDYPSIKIVLDIHRDALGTDDVVYKTMAEEEGVVASQIMLLVGTDESGLEHPNWRQNLALALYIQNSVNARHPTLMRPVSLVRERYNQQLSPGSRIVEVGSNGNTLQEALAAIRLFGNAAAPALAQLVEQPQEGA